MRDADTLTRPAFLMPRFACDSHVHIFEDASRYASVKTPHYTLPDGGLANLQRMIGVLGLERFVIVQPSYYGTDNRCLLDALSVAGPCARGVAMVDENCTDEELSAMHRRGVRALRLDLFLRSSWATADICAYVERAVRRTRAIGWHVQFYTPGWVVRDLLPFLGRLDADFVIDHMGYMLESDGLGPADFDRLIGMIPGGPGVDQTLGSLSTREGRQFRAPEANGSRPCRSCTRPSHLGQRLAAYPGRRQGHRRASESAGRLGAG